MDHKKALRSDMIALAILLAIMWSFASLAAGSWLLTLSTAQLSGLIALVVLASAAIMWRLRRAMMHVRIVAERKARVMLVIADIRTARSDYEKLTDQQSAVLNLPLTPIEETTLKYLNANAERIIADAQKVYDTWQRTDLKALDGNFTGPMTTEWAKGSIKRLQNLQAVLTETIADLGSSRQQYAKLEDQHRYTSIPFTPPNSGGE